MKFIGLNPGWVKIFHTCPAWPWGQPSPFYNGYQVFLGEGGKSARAWHRPPTLIWHRG